jgi:diguanylate cyclase (GGDEF)-like protein
MKRKVKKLILWVLSGLLVASSCSAFGIDYDSSEKHFRQQLTDAETAWIEKHESITYVYDPDWPPFEWKSEKGIHTGIIADLLALLGKNSGLKFKPQNTDTWSESVALVREGEADMFSAITVTDERKHYLNFTSGDIYSYPAVLVTLFDDNDIYIDIEKDARLKTIAIVKDSGLGRYIRQSYPSLNYVEVPSTRAGFTAVMDGDADLFAINTITARYFIEQWYQDEIKIATKLDYIYHLKIAVRKDRPAELISILDKALSTVLDSEQSAIFNHWTHVERSASINWELFAELFSIFLIIFALLVWHNIKLKKLVNLKTKELTRLVNTDELTGANNRRKLDIDFSHEMKRASRNHHRMALLYIDLNNFKIINDTHGHKFGDLVLTHVATKVIDSLRDTEKLYRLGGDEFCILLPEITDRDHVLQMVERLKYLLENIGTLKDKSVEIGCSVGIAIFPDDGEYLDTLITTADHDMYREKAIIN